MRMLICGLALSLGTMASPAKAETKVTVDGAEYELSALMEDCRSMSGAPEAQIACFTKLSELLEKQGGEAEARSISVPEALDALRAVAQYQDDGSGLSIVGNDCNIRIVYFNNYFHLSRRNVSMIDLFSAQFDASKLQYDRTAEVRGAQAPLLSGLMEAGATATTAGGVALESTVQNFAPKSARASIFTYANEVVSQLTASQDQAFDFVLVHPERHKRSAEIWSAFETFATACRA